LVPKIGGRHDRKLNAARSRACAPRYPQGSRPRRRGGARVRLERAGADLGRGGGASERRGDLERRILGQNGGRCTQTLAQARRRAETGRAAASASIPRARLVELGTVFL